MAEEDLKVWTTDTLLGRLMLVSKCAVPNGYTLQDGTWETVGTGATAAVLQWFARWDLAKDQAGEIFASNDYIAWSCKIPLRTAVKAIRVLKECGILRKDAIRGGFRKEAHLDWAAILTRQEQYIPPEQDEKHAQPKPPTPARPVAASATSDPAQQDCALADRLWFLGGWQGGPGPLAQKISRVVLVDLIGGLIKEFGEQAIEQAVQGISKRQLVLLVKAKHPRAYLGKMLTTACQEPSAEAPLLEPEAVDPEPEAAPTPASAPPSPAPSATPNLEAVKAAKAFAKAHGGNHAATGPAFDALVQILAPVAGPALHQKIVDAFAADRWFGQQALDHAARTFVKQIDRYDKPGGQGPDVALTGLSSKSMAQELAAAKAAQAAKAEHERPKAAQAVELDPAGQRRRQVLADRQARQEAADEAQTTTETAMEPA